MTWPARVTRSPLVFGLMTNYLQNPLHGVITRLKAELFLGYCSACESLPSAHPPQGVQHRHNERGCLTLPKTLRSATRRSRTPDAFPGGGSVSDHSIKGGRVGRPDRTTVRWTWSLCLGAEI